MRPKKQVTKNNVNAFAVALIEKLYECITGDTMLNILDDIQNEFDDLNQWIYDQQKVAEKMLRKE